MYNKPDSGAHNKIKIKIRVLKLFYYIYVPKNKKLALFTLKFINNKSVFTLILFLFLLHKTV